MSQNDNEANNQLEIKKVADSHKMDQPNILKQTQIEPLPLYQTDG